MNAWFRSVLALAMLCALAGLAIAQGGDRTAFGKAMETEDTTQKITALKKFAADFPRSQYRGRAYFEIFRAHVKVGNERDALDAAARCLAAVPENQRGMPCNSLAWTLAEAEMGLDSAAAYAERAVAWARASGPRQLSSFLNTQAYVTYKQGDAAKAEKLQQEAIAGREENAELLGRLALYQHDAGHRREAIKSMAKTILYSPRLDMEDAARFEVWLEAEAPEPAGRDALSKEIVSGLVEAHIAEADSADQSVARSRAAVLMAAAGVDVNQAETWARDAVAVLTDEAEISQIIALRRNLSQVHMLQKNNAAAVAAVAPIVHLAPPWDSGFWLELGGLYEKLDQTEKAVDTYIQSAALRPQPEIMSALERAFVKLHGSSEGLDGKVEAARASLETFDPGRYTPDAAHTGQVVLAELFTGAECPPCLAADLAFDALAEYYPRTTLAILEYHLHIPGPDPMTNDDTVARSQYYGARFGTPTVFINGGDKMTGGGPKIATQNRFALYNHIIQRRLKNRPSAVLTGTASLNDNAVAVSLTAKLQPGKPSPQLHIALADRSVDYTGGNGLAHHAFVVRKLVDGADGIVPEWQDRTASVSKRFVLSEVEVELAAYLEAFADNPPERYRRRFAGWKSRPEKLNRSNLIVVAWLQDPDSKQVLQSCVIPVK